jgi:hypothetical protein
VPQTASETRRLASRASLDCVNKAGYEPAQAN